MNSNKLRNVGYHAAKFCQESGARLVGVSEYEVAIYDADGIDLEDLMRHRKQTGSILDFPNAKNLDCREDALELECDILIPAALENVITKENAPRTKARIIGEAANGPITAAEDILEEKGVWVIPDFYLNAGGVTVSYFEWLKNLSHVRFGRIEKRFEQNAFDRILKLVEKETGRSFSVEERNMVAHGADEAELVYSGLEETMVVAYQQIREVLIQNKEAGTLRTAAFMSAINKIAVCYGELGIFP